MTWHVTVVYDADGTQTREFTGSRVSTQILSDGRSLVQIRDEAGHLVEAFHTARVWSIHRVLRADSTTG